MKKTGDQWDFYDAPDATGAVVKNWVSGNDIVFWSWYPFDDDVNGTLVSVI